MADMYARCQAMVAQHNPRRVQAPKSCKVIAVERSPEQIGFRRVCILLAHATVVEWLVGFVYV